ncbi:MAG: ATP-binding cassette domain-containing protein [Crenarchaeota archaeon]|nr:ATP-binding cassette domain-containing protein [Thermoproteota archaeon]
MEAVLRAEDIHVTYPNGVRANVGVTLEVRGGEVLGLLGENGAGKTTLVKVLSGLLRPDKGRIIYMGREVVFNTPRDALRLGIILAPQTPRLFPGLTVAEDVGLTMRLAGRGMGLQEVRRRLREISREYGLGVDPDARVWRLSMGERQRVNLAKIIMLDARVALLDEPTTHLTPMERRSLVQVMRRMASEGRAVVFITHRIGEALEACDRIAVMRKGRLVGVVERGEASREQLLRMMFGDYTPSKPSRRSGGPGAGRVLELVEVWVRGPHGTWAVRGASMSVEEGCVVGVAGVAGNGQRELFETVVGLRRPVRGRVLLMGVDVTRAPPLARRRMGMAVIPEERLGWGLVPGRSIVFNIAFAHAWLDGGFMVDWQSYRRLAEEIVSAMKVKARSVEDPVDSLSGGNMQRLLLGRELLRGARLVAAMNPTAGLDARTAEAVDSMLVEAASRGAGVLVFSEDLDELMTISDKIYVMSRGRLHGPFMRPFDYKAVAAAMTAG